MATTPPERGRRRPSATGATGASRLALAIPLGTLAIEPLYVLVDTAIVGRLGAAPLGGWRLASTVLTTLLWVCNFLAVWHDRPRCFLTGRGDDAGGADVAPKALWLAAAHRQPGVAGSC